MGQKEKLIERLKAKPRTFAFDDAEMRITDHVCVR